VWVPQGQRARGKATSSRAMAGWALAARVPYPQKNTFIQYPALRNPSLEEYIREREAQSCPVSPRYAIFEGELPSPPPGQPPLLPGRAGDLELAHAFKHDKDVMSRPTDERVDASSESSDSSSSDSNVEEDSEQKMKVISLSSGLGIQSRGSRSHQSGCCKPCAFFWKDGCKNGQDCQYCHLCPPGELKRRKKARAMMLRRQCRYSNPRRNERLGRTAQCHEWGLDGCYPLPAGAFGGA